MAARIAIKEYKQKEKKVMEKEFWISPKKLGVVTCGSEEELIWQINALEARDNEANEKTKRAIVNNDR